MRATRWLTTLLLLTVFAAPAAAAEPGILRPLGEQTRDSDPGEFATLPDGTVLFSADDGEHGRELWRTDGTAAGTAMVADVVPGPVGSEARELTVIDGVAYFKTGQQYYGDPDTVTASFWRTDGTAAGTRRLITLPGQTFTPDDVPFFAFKGEVVFTVKTDWAVFSFYATDGTPEGTRKLDVLPESGFAPEHWCVAGGYLFFDFNDKLWRTDGTKAGTTSIEGAGRISDLFEVQGHLVAVSGEGTLATVAPGETTAKALAESYNLQNATGGRLYFTSINGFESWAPGEGRKLVSDVPANDRWSHSNGRENIMVSGDRLFWGGSKHWDVPTRLYTQGPEGVHQVPGRAVEIDELFPLGDGRVIFSAADESDEIRRALWVSDGTAVGTRRLTESNPFGGNRLAVASRGVVGIHRTLEAGDELHRVDDAATRFDLLVDINKRTVGSDPTDAARVGDRVVFKTNEQKALWTTDGTFDGTVPLLERDSGGLPLDPFGLASDDDLALFAARDGIYRTDGTPAGTAQIADLGVDAESFNPLARVGTTSVLAARKRGEISHDLWRTDGTAAGTQRLTTGAHLGAANVALGGAGTMLVSGQFGGVWATDGTAAGSRKLFPQQGAYTVPEAIAVDDGFLVSGDDGVRGEELWHVDPQGGSPRLVKEFYPGVQGSFPRLFGRTGNRMLFAVHFAGREYGWHTMDLATEQIEPMTWIEGQAVDWPATAGGVTYIATYTTYHTNLYRTDGTEAGTQLLRRFDGEFSAVPSGFTHFDGVTYFVAEDAEHGVELWRTDGTPAGTRLARDIRPGETSSYPGNLVATGDLLFFTADDEQYGPEPWRILRTTPSPGKPVDEDPPVTIAPLPVPETAPAPRGSSADPLPVKAATLSIRAQRLKTLRGATRWRVTGAVSAGACTGRVQIVLGRGDRALKRVPAPLRKCRFSAVVSTASRSSGRWLQVRTVRSSTVPSVQSRRVRAGR